jgi:ribosomal protein L37AE/L43A
MINRCIKCGEDWSIREENGNYVCPECRKMGAAGGGGSGEVITMEKIYYRLIELEERVYQLEHPEEFREREGN